MKSRGFFSPLKRSWLPKLARTGLISKGVVYCILGTLAFLAAFEIYDESTTYTGKEDVSRIIGHYTGECIIIALIAVGLLSFTAWRIMESISSSNHPYKEKTPAIRARYFFSGLVYFSVAVYAITYLFVNNGRSSNGSSDIVTRLLLLPSGKLFVFICALCIAGIGIYQGYYGLSENYRKHVSKLNVSSKKTGILLRSARIGYISRGIVWLMIAFLLINAAVHSNAHQAGNSTRLFGFIERSPFGSYMLGILGLGLIFYGVFNFIRARYENF
jgi:hypothetical protein